MLKIDYKKNNKPFSEEESFNLLSESKSQSLAS